MEVGFYVEDGEIIIIYSVVFFFLEIVLGVFVMGAVGSWELEGLRFRFCFVFGLRVF